MRCFYYGRFFFIPFNMNMLKKIFFLLASCMLPFSGQCRVVETARIADVIPLIDEDTWFLVDLDNTLFEAAQSLGHAKWFYDLANEKMGNGMTREEAIDATYPEWIRTQKICKVKPLEEDFVPSLISLQEKGIVVMGFTHRQTSVASATVKQVNSLGFSFTRTAPCEAVYSIPAKKSPAQFIHGILFVGDHNKKVDILIPFLSLVSATPKKIVFIDDKRKNVEELEPVLEGLGIEYIGVHYTAIEYAKPVYFRELADFQMKFLDQIMSNESALLLMEKGIE